jgi:hypothetical protein
MFTVADVIPMIAGVVSWYFVWKYLRLKKLAYPFTVPPTIPLVLEVGYRRLSSLAGDQ